VPALIEITRTPEPAGAEWIAADGTVEQLWLDRPQPDPTEHYEVEEIGTGAAVAPDEAPFLYLVRMDVDPAHEDEFNDWYTTDHVANLATVPGVHSARRFRAVNAAADTRRYLAMYRLDLPGVRQTGAWQRAAHTDWSIRIRAHHRRKLATMFERAARR
jgi:hypothetical protein